MPKGNIFKTRLAQMQTAANDAMQGYVPGGLQVPDDIYNARLQGELTESQAGNLMITRTFTVMEGDYQGLKIWDHIVLEKLDEDGETRIPSYMGIIQSRRWLESMGIEFPEDDLGQLDEIITQISECAPACRIRSKTSKSRNSDDEYTHVTVLELLDWGEETEAPAEEAPAEEEQPADETGEEYTPEDSQEEGGDITIEDLLTFAAAQGITELNDSMDGETIVATLLTYQYKENELTEDEKLMLEAIGLPSEQIISAVPQQVKVTPPKRTIAKTTAKTTAKTVAKKTTAKTTAKKPPATPPKRTVAATTKGKLPPRIGQRK